MPPLFHLGMIMVSFGLFVFVLFGEGVLKGDLNKSNRRKWLPRMLMYLLMFVVGAFLAIFNATPISP
ncbi:MAG: hypothetical protein HY395_01585 [Candidatus Doudnabacteria bacterium]|nr:hypothetical protein [Candidatus Doudnabacteria bacterium]